MRKRYWDKTVAQIAIQVLKENNCDWIMFGDVILLDEIGLRAAHTNLMKLHPLKRHSRILDYLEKSGLFNVDLVKLNGIMGNPYWRILKLKEEIKKI